MKVEWRTGIGYGDFVTGLGYSRNLYYKSGLPLQFLFHWKNSKDFYYTEKDKETLFHRFEYIESLFERVPVDISHKFNSFPGYRFLNQFDEFNYLHGLGRTNLVPEYKKIAVLWTTRNNKEFPGIHKDPVFDKWDRITGIVRDHGYDVVEIDYRTPVREVIELIRISEFGIGYDGLAHQLYKFMWKPLIVFCGRLSLNKLLIPWAKLYTNSNDFEKEGVDRSLLYSEMSMSKVSDEYDEYLSKTIDYRSHPLYNRYT